VSPEDLEAGWEAYLVRLPQFEGVTPFVADGVVSLWRSARARVPGLGVPQAGPFPDDEGMQLCWWAGDTVLVVDVCEDETGWSLIEPGQSTHRGYVEGQMDDEFIVALRRFCGNGTTGNVGLWA
jgi:hypothetical protein